MRLNTKIRSVSQFKQSLKEVDTFFVDDLRIVEPPIKWRQKNFNPFKLNSSQFPKAKLDENVLDPDSSLALSAEPAPLLGKANNLRVNHLFA
jgi:hypothetical protein